MTGTPVIDPGERDPVRGLQVGGLLAGTVFYQRLHAIDLASGSEKRRLAGQHRRHLPGRQRQHDRVLDASGESARRARARQRHGLHRLGRARGRAALVRLGDGLYVQWQHLHAAVGAQRLAQHRRGGHLDGRRRAVGGLQRHLYVITGNGAFDATSTSGTDRRLWRLVPAAGAGGRQLSVCPHASRPPISRTTTSATRTSAPAARRWC